MDIGMILAPILLVLLHSGHQKQLLLALHSPPLHLVDEDSLFGVLFPEPLHHLFVQLPPYIVFKVRAVCAKVTHLATFKARGSACAVSTIWQAGHLFLLRAWSS